MKISVHLERPGWEVRLLGEFSIRVPSGELFRNRSPYLPRLVTMLGTRRGEPVRRSVLAANLFDEDRIEDPTAGLRTVLSRVRQATEPFGGDLIESESSEIGLGSNVWCDADAFVEHFERAQRASTAAVQLDEIEAALKLWRGPLSPELSVPWVLPIRDRFSAMFESAFTDCVNLAIKLGAPMRALQFAEFAGQASPPTASLTMALMQLYIAMGKKESAVEAFESYDDWLYQHLGIGPAHDLEMLFDRACRLEPKTRRRRRASGTSRIAVPPKPRATYGRQKELLAATSWIGSAAPGTVLTITGLAGIGKSHFLRSLYWEFNATKRPVFLDLESSPASQGEVSGSAGLGSLVLVDHASAVHRPFLEQLQHGGAILIVASHDRLGLENETDLILGGLSTSRFGAGRTDAELLFEAEWMNAALLKPDLYLPTAHLREASTLCDGIPLALELAARLAASIGIGACVQALRRALGALGTRNSSVSRHDSIEAAVKASIAELSFRARTVLEVFIELPGPVHVGLLEEISPGSHASEVDELVHSGLLRSGRASGYFEVLPSVAAIAARGTEQRQTRVSSAVASKEIAAWFERTEPFDIARAASLPLAIWAIRSPRCHPADALRLIAALQPYVCSVPLERRWVEECEARIEQAQVLDDLFFTALLAVAAMRFHLGDYEEMLGLLKSDRIETALGGIGSNLKLRVETNRALAYRANGRLELAESEYRRIAGAADEAKLTSRAGSAYFNLACTLESRELFELAAEAYECAQSRLEGNSDPRVGILAIEGRARMLHLLGERSDQALVLYRVALDRAVELGDQRIVSPILQNLGALQTDMGRFDQAVLSSVAGSAMLISLGWSEEIRRKVVSSLASIGLAVLKLGHESVAREVARALAAVDAESLWSVARRHCLELRKSLGLDGAQLSAASSLSKTEFETLLTHCADSIQQNLETARQREYADWIARIA